MSIERYEHSNELALSTTQDVAVQRLGEWAQSADAAYGVAQRLSESSFVPQQFRGKPVELCAAILSGLEVGLSPMAAMRSFDIIQGQAAPRAVTLRAVVQSHGHEMVLEESTATRCRMKGKRRGSNEWQRVVWTMDRARDLGLATKDGWKKQPTAMLVARATSELARLIASDAILGIAHSAEEIADGATFDQQVDAETAMPSAPSGTRRMGRNLAPVEDHPETDDIEPDDEAAPLLDPQSALAKRMFATFREVGIDDKPARLEFIAGVIGREISSSSEMTEVEASRTINALTERLENPFPADPA
jgi:hypothetical protein